MNEPFTVVGIGDMSGDVFGNGMLYSDQICLVAAFDHRHVFVDPPNLRGRRTGRLFRRELDLGDYDRRDLARRGVWPRR
jgi:glutamate dehydrogenase